jgi:glyoxylase-like metal-dependent hydrolase (beta-lactamase superfamily II)
MRLGDFFVYSLSDGFFALDGGAMFGVVPRVFWQKSNPPDDRNRIALALRPLLIKTPDALVLVDTGIGDKQDRKFNDIYKVDHVTTLAATLRGAGFRPEQVTHVINTHLHFDHCGGNTVRTPDALIAPTFKRAKYVVQTREWEIATKPDVRSRASYVDENFLALHRFSLLYAVDGDVEITPGVRVIRTGGHTAGHQVVLVESGTEKIVYWGDLIPTASHLNVPYVMGYDTEPLVTIAQKERLLTRAAVEHWLMCFEHDPEIAFAYLKQEKGRYLIDQPVRDYSGSPEPR